MMDNFMPRIQIELRGISRDFTQVVMQHHGEIQKYLEENAEKEMQMQIIKALPLMVKEEISKQLKNVVREVATHFLTERGDYERLHLYTKQAFEKAMIEHIKEDLNDEALTEMLEDFLIKESLSPIGKLFFKFFKSKGITK